MTLLAEAGTFTEKLTTGTHTVSFADATLLPKVIFFWTPNLLSNSTTTTNIGCFGCWADDSSAQAVMEWRDDDAQATMMTGRRFDGAKIIQLCDSLGAALAGVGAATISSVTTGSFTPNWSTVQGDARIMNYFALGGTDITNVDLNTFTSPTSTQTVSYNIGFQPDCLIVFGSGGTANPGGSANYMAVLGVYDGSTQLGLGWASLSGAADATTQCRQNTGRFIDLLQNDAAVVTATVAITSTGYDITYTAVDASARYFNVLAIKGVRAKVFSTTQPTSTGTQAITGAGGTPKGVLIFTGGNDNTNIANSIAVNIGAGSSSGYTSAGWTSTDAAATSVCDRWQSGNLINMLAQNGGTANATATLSSLDSDGITLNWATADATARNFGGIMFAPRGGILPKLQHEGLYVGSAV